MGEIDVELFAFIFFWVALWGILNIIIRWLFLQMGTYYDPGIAVLIYLLIAVCSIYVINTILNEKKKEDKNKDEDKDN